MVTLAGFCVAIALSAMAMYAYEQSPLIPYVRAQTAYVETIPKLPQVLGITIANTGLVYVRGARVTSLAYGQFSVSLEWGNMHFEWVVSTPSATRFVTSSGKKMSQAELYIGDSVAITGLLDTTARTPTILAQFVREQ